MIFSPLPKLRVESRFALMETASFSSSTATCAHSLWKHDPLSSCCFSNAFVSAVEWKLSFPKNLLGHNKHWGGGVKSCHAFLCIKWPLRIWNSLGIYKEASKMSVVAMFKKKRGFWGDSWLTLSDYNYRRHMWLIILSQRLLGIMAVPWYSLWVSCVKCIHLLCQYNLHEFDTCYRSGINLHVLIPFSFQYAVE